MGVFMRLGWDLGFGFVCWLGFGSGFGNLSRQPCPSPHPNPSVSCWVSGSAHLALSPAAVINESVWIVGAFASVLGYYWVPRLELGQKK